MTLDDRELLDEFVIESREGLGDIVNQMLAIESAGEHVDIDLVNAVFRTMHTIKGTSGFLGLDRIGTLAHALEELLDQMRTRHLTPATDLVSSMLRATDVIKEMIDAVETSNEVDVSDYVAELQRYRVGAARPSEPIAPAAVPMPSVPMCSTPEEASASETGTPKPGEGAGVGTVPASTIATDLGWDQPPTPSDRSERADSPTPISSWGPASSVGPVSSPGSCPQEPVAAEPTPDRAATSPVETTIRVDVALLDKLMTRVGELVLARNQILQFTSQKDDPAFLSTAQRLNLITTELQEGVMKTRMQPIGNVWAKFPRVVRDLSASLGKFVRIEMEGHETELDKTIVEAIKDPLTHLVRNAIDHGLERPEARRAAGKPGEGRLTLRAFHEGGQVNIEISDDGGGLDLDRIRRKAVERGLVAADQAARLSDREASQLILLPGFSTAETITSISGRGVGMDVVKTNIERIGGTIDLQSQRGSGTTIKIKIPLTLAIVPALIVTHAGDRYAIPQVSLLELLRLEGDQVGRAIESIGGATFCRLRGKLLPLLDLTEQLDLTKQGDPAEPRDPSTDRRWREESSPRGEHDRRGPTPSGRDSSRDGRPDPSISAPTQPAVVNIVVLRANERQFGLIVDRINDTEEIVVKPLSSLLRSLTEFAGATILGDGTVALILDVMGLATAAGVVCDVRDGTLAQSTDDAAVGAEPAQLLVVDLGDHRRFGLPTSMISRLEKVSARTIESSGGRDVIRYRGSILPIVRLTEVLGRVAWNDDSHRDPDDLNVVVSADAGHQCGFVVNRIIDIVETEPLPRLQERSLAPDDPTGMDDLAAVRQAASPSGALLGTVVVQDRVTDVVDLRFLAAEHGSPIRPLTGDFLR